MSRVGSTASLHHIGYVVADIVTVIQAFAIDLECSWDDRIIHDPLQGAFVAFLSPSKPGGPLFELVAPAGGGSPVTKFLEKGGGLHHLCYEVDSVDTQLAVAKAQGSLVVRKPLPAVAFDGRRIAWIYSRQRLLIEYLERAG